MKSNNVETTRRKFPGTIASGVAALRSDPAEAKRDWLSGMLPGIKKVVPAGIWAINRPQEKGCSYRFAG